MCFFFQRKIEYLGHVIDKNGLHKSLKKVEAIVKISEPQSVTQVKAFIGMANYYAKFIPGLAIKLAPQYNLLNKNE